MSEPDDPQISFFRRHRFTIVASSLALVLLLLTGGSAYAGFVAGVAKYEASAVPIPVEPEEEPARVVPTVLPAASPLRTCRISSIAVDPRLSALTGEAVNTATGEVLFSRDADDAVHAGSVMGALTATAAIGQLGADHQLSTQVLDSKTKGTIVLVGGGDATLSRLPAGQTSVYAGAPTLADLAAKTLAAYTQAHPNTPITHVVLDATYWDKADRWNTTWSRDLQTGGFVSEVTSLQVDGDREDPTAQISPRSTDPIGRAGSEFVAALGLDPDEVSVQEGTAENGAPVLAEVKSAPISTLVQQMLLANDATLAEMLARVVAVESNFSGSAASLQQAIPDALEAQGFAPRGTTIRDGSGLSRDDAVSTHFVTTVMSRIATDPTLAPIMAALPVAGQSGSFADRFTGDNAGAAGKVAGVSGALPDSRSIAGVMTAIDGTTISFSFVASRANIGDDAQEALDALVTGVHNCGNNLSNN
ncbi:MAG TPA: D-alanyl-D-alanine carboxypeptidase/D-alanyl-D-alanine-endopeptidase [Glaciihabitans sp.]|nr:D-alanyl-D-alanine carboxypeptidase/D-alanyl-D-alanine-endopeptidase [Glaciihabitans sp.]